MMAKAVLIGPPLLGGLFIFWRTDSLGVKRERTKSLRALEISQFDVCFPNNQQTNNKQKTNEQNQSMTWRARREWGPASVRSAS